MKNVKLYLEGPGREQRPVTFLSTEQVCAGTLGFITRRASESNVEINLLADADGNVARQIDHDGYLYKFNGSEARWALIVA